MTIPGLGANIDFDAFYSWLDSKTVPIPDHGDGDPVSPREVGALLVKVQANRGDVSRAMSLLERRAGEAKREVGVMAERVRLEQAKYETGQFWRRFPAKDRRAAAIRNTEPMLADLTAAKGRKDLVDAAIRAVKVQLDTLETCKQTLNTLARIGDEIPDAFSAKNRRPFR